MPLQHAREPIGSRFGVLTCLVSQGTRELGIRMALGASPGAVVWLVGRHTAVIAR